MSPFEIWKLQNAFKISNMRIFLESHCTRNFEIEIHKSFFNIALLFHIHRKSLFKYFAQSW